ncbi:hypothetical protein C8F04DRAFT_1199650 [Mycena alexandri]|uniref:Uncharacterized protein n=1 Tax=Mycena alexandri TaxID=1745969 RepID=A0AAD6RZ00_9AGAR|nr:hypothetical protein C8F04DRAFT_1199650 [Mycena alexandri]
MFDATQQGVQAVQPAPGESVFEQVILIDPTEGSVETPEVRWQSAPMNGVMAIHADARSYGNLHADARSCGDARHRRGNGNSRRCTEFRQPTPMHGVTAAHTDARSHSNIRADAQSHGNIPLRIVARITAGLCPKFMVGSVKSTKGRASAEPSKVQ